MEPRNRPTARWRDHIDPEGLREALEQIAIAMEDRCELEARRILWWFEFTLEDRGRSPAPFQPRALDLHVLRGRDCIARASSWRELTEQMRWIYEYRHAIPALRDCPLHPPRRRGSRGAAR